MPQCADKTLMGVGFCRNIIKNFKFVVVSDFEGFVLRRSLESIGGPG